MIDGSAAPSAAPEGALVLFSGGQDSTVCLAWALDRYARVETVGFDYGQRHAVELQARQAVRAGMTETFPRWASRLGEDHMLEIRGFGAIGGTAMTEERAFEISEKGLPNSYVPGRNLVFLTYAAALADRRGLRVLVGGMCETDYSGYPDCRRDAIDAMERALNLGMAQDFRIETPLMKLTKAETWALAKRLGGEALVALTVKESHTCYRGERGELHAWGHGCGTCPACELRAKGWDEWAAGGRPELAA
ncbi:7-cyano-7-deazaguanine synthase QueC [Phenylobacterium sp. J426]|uniref:7-cyano-7-deazaguanine synthase QueC n=1 Tax=Phenylobacterium sp. J426 TaxID=2898439 RepID=UPI0021511AE2|nr:7-cyano-7-deazaguanine synthase QueC [Phenylobacterium sp. J426]MCR5873004.1 7-cyano-7-deazaguanine synthase QueC [Phenylobacterium sp. J426]